MDDAKLAKRKQTKKKEAKKKIKKENTLHYAYSLCVVMPSGWCGVFF
jgi:hypothetical protein